MKTLEELEVGKWYTSNYWIDENSYAKFLKGSLERFYFSESIRRDYWKKEESWWGASISSLFREVPLEEIQKYLPDWHPDKMINPIFKKGDLVRILKQSHGWGIIKPGDVGRVDRIDDKCLYVKFEKNSFNWIGTFECFELVSEKSTTKELTELPEKWYFKVTHDNYEKFKDIRSLSRVYGYISSNPVYDLSWGLIYSDPPFGHTEISFEAFEKHVLSKEKTKTISSKPEKTWNPKFKVGDKVRIPVSKKGNLWYKNNVSELDDYHKDYFIISCVIHHDKIGLKRDDHKVFRENSFYEEDLVLYTEPTKEEWVPKVGDWVWDTVNKKCLRIKNFDTVGDLILEKQGGTYKSQCRKAEPWEIPFDKQETEISVIDLPTPDFYTSIKYIKGPSPYVHFNHGDPIVTTKPLTPKESFKLNKLPTKSWY